MKAGWLAGILLTTAVVGCGPGADEPQDEVLLVSAAASLTDAFEVLAAAFESDHPHIDVLVNTAGSSALREQILEGAPADVFASADRANMEQLVGAGEVDRASYRALATNSLQIAVPAGNPARVRGLEDFGNDDLVLGLCAEATPCGRLANEALTQAGVVPSVDTREPHARALIIKVASGELDAGIAYRTDVSSAGAEVDGLDLPPEAEVRAEYTIAVLSSAASPESARLFVDFALSERGQAILAEYGFGAP